MLVVDDQAEILKVCQGMLSSAGLEVITAKGPAEALRKIEDPAQSFDHLLLDAAMPGSDSRALRRSIRALRPDLPIVLMSGYSKEELQAIEGSLESPDIFLPKPFASTELLRALNQAKEKRAKAKALR